MQGCATHFEQIYYPDFSKHLKLRNAITNKLNVRNIHRFGYVAVMYDLKNKSVDELKKILKDPHKYYSKNQIRVISENFVFPSQR